MEENKITYFAETDSRNRKVTFGIKSKDRSRHVYIIGKTGMGKSTLLENMAIQDIQNGEGMAFIDPHGKTADLLLEYVPENRIKDVIYFAPFDTDYPVSFNVMEDVGPDKRHLVSNGLMSAFKKIWVDAWSARMEYILGNILLALLEYPGSTLLGVNRMLADKDFRNLVVANVKDPAVKAFWIDEFAKYGEKYMQEAGAAIQNKIGQFVSNPLVRNIIGQPKSSFNMREVMDEKKIIIINLSKGRVGEANANLLGSMMITKIYLSAMSRADTPEAKLRKLPNFYLYVDEFQSFANESFADILSEARKYKLNLTIAHQYIEQMSDEVRAAVFGNVGTMISFRVGAYDAEVLEKEFAPVFTAEDLVNLGFVQIYLKLMIDGISSSPFSATTMAPIKKPDIILKDQIIENSRKVFAQPKEVVEEHIRGWHLPIKVEPKKDKKKEEKQNLPNSPKFPEVKDSGMSENNSGSGVFVQRNDVKEDKKEEKKNPFASIKVVDGVVKMGNDEEKKNKTASLKTLEKQQPTPKKENGKDMTEKSKNELRDLLSLVVKKDEKKEEKKIEKKMEEKKPEQKKVEVEKKENLVKNEEPKIQKPKEIPEDVLNKMLQIDEK